MMIEHAAVRPTPETDDEHLGTIFDQAFAGIDETNRTGRIIRVNDRFCKIVGRPREELLRLGFQDITHPEDLPRDLALFERLLSHGEPFEIEKRYVRPDGTAAWVQKNASPVIGTAGTLVRVMAIVVDISARKQAEEAAKQSADRFRFMAESMPQKIFTAKPNGDVDYLNQQWTDFTGLSFDDMKARGWSQVVHPEDVEENIRVWKRSLDTGEPFQLEHRFRGADGVYRWHLSRAHAMRDASGAITMWIGSNTDIDEVKRTEHALHDANQRKDEFLAMLGHELRNPLAPILSALELMKLRGQATGAEHEREMIERQVRHVARLVDDLLDVSKISRGKISLEREPIEIFVAIVKAIELARPVI
jgi:PAS domain S-box-containing protein